MGRKSKHTKEEKIEIVRKYDNGEGSCETLGKSIGVNESTVRRWVNHFHANGESAFDNKPRNQTYTKEFKEEVVQAYLNGEGSYRDLAVRYNISNESTVINWVKEYNTPEGLKDYNLQGEARNMKSRKTTKEERIEIVKYCIEHDKDYAGTALKYNVPYHNVYNWFNKYVKDGEDGLDDGRGHHKKDEDLTDMELLQKKLDQVERELEMKDLEIRLLKKVKSVERRDWKEKAALNQNISQSTKPQKK